MYTSVKQSISMYHSKDLQAGYKSLEALALLKGFKDVGTFNVHYAIYYNFDDTGAQFFNCVKR